MLNVSDFYILVALKTDPKNKFMFRSQGPVADGAIPAHPGVCHQQPGVQRQRNCATQ